MTNYSTPKKYLDQWDEYNSMSPGNKKMIREMLTEFATMKCKEVARNVRHKAIEVSLDTLNKAKGLFSNQIINRSNNEIMNIQYKEVKSF